MRYSIISFILLAATAFGKEKPPFKYVPIKAPNSCLPNAICFISELEVRNRMAGSKHWAKVLSVVFTSGTRHAIAVYEWKGRIYAYDYLGSRLLSKDTFTVNNPEWLGTIYGVQTRNSVLYSYYEGEELTKSESVAK